MAAEPLTDWGNWDVVALLLNQGNSISKQKTGNQGDDCDRARAQISLLLKKKREGQHLKRAEYLKKEESVETRETLDRDQGECRHGESTQENTKQAFQLEFDCETRKIPKQFSQTSSKTSTQFLWTTKILPYLRDLTG